MSEKKPRDRTRELRRVRVKSNISITPRTRRIVFEGRGLADFETVAPAQWVKLFFPKSDGDAPTGRAYTIRHFNPDQEGELTIDFFMHQGGVGSAWAASAEVGDEIEFGAPRSEFRIHEDAEWYLLAGDETSLPGICSILEKLACHAEVWVFVEVADHTDEVPLFPGKNRYVHWLCRGSLAAGTTNLLAVAIRQAQIPRGKGQAWVAGETSAVHAVRSVLLHEKKMDRASIHASGYWKRGEVDHKDSTSDY